jgi:RNA polymerase sigma-70 factor (ECF subfamily)
MVRPAEQTPVARPGELDFDAWMRSEQTRVLRLCCRLLGDRDEADTAAQEVFLKAFRVASRMTGQVPDAPAAWLTTVTVNTCLDRLRSRRWQFWRRRMWGQDEEKALALVRDTAPTAEQGVQATEIARRLAAALPGLSERQRAVFVLRHYDDLSLEEIAGTLGIDVGTVKAHLARALAKLRKELHDLYFGSGGRT